jgi:hypothetical protein
MEGQITWRVHRGRLLGLAIELPPQWIADRVHIVGAPQATRWAALPSPSGRTQIQVALSSSLEAGRSLTLQVSASAAELGSSGVMSLPRLKPLGAELVDDLWRAQIEAGWRARPTAAQGLVWIDPFFVLPEADRPFDFFLGIRGHLAWRWLQRDGGAEVERVQVTPTPSADIRCLATVEAERLICDWLVTLELPPQAIVMTSSAPFEGLTQWHLAETTAGIPLPSRLLDAKARAALGLPSDRMAWSVELPRARMPRVRLRCRTEAPWSGRGAIPLISVPRPFHSHGTLVVLCERDMQSTANATLARRLDPEAAWREITAGYSAASDSSPSFDLARHRRAHAFGYDADPGGITLATETLTPGPTEGVIEEAVLATQTATFGPARHRLTLRVAPTTARLLAVSLPAGTILERAHTKGAPLSATREGGKLMFPLDPPTAEQPATTLVLEYQSSAEDAIRGGLLHPGQPSFSLPCMSFCWELAIARPWDAEAPDLGLIDVVERVTEHGALEPAWESINWPMGSGRRAGQLSSAEVAMYRDVDARAAALESKEMTIADWLTRCDAGRWPLVVDRLALAATGLGPRSTFAPKRPAAARLGRAAEDLQPLGLNLLALGDVLLVTSQAQARALQSDPGAELRWRAHLRAAASTGSDSWDRFQSVHRWRGEPTPEGVEWPLPPGPNTPLRRRVFETTGLPPASASVRLASSQAQWTWSLAIGLGILGVGLLTRNPSPKRRAAALAGALALAWLIAVWSAGPVARFASGALGGLVCLLALWSATSARTAVREREPSRRTPAPARARASSVDPARLGAVWILAATVCRLATGAPQDPTKAARPILALFPFDNIAELETRGDRVLLLLSDFERLQAAAHAADLKPQGSLVAVSSEHHVRWQGTGDAWVESEYELRLDGSLSATWTVPIDQPRDLSATLDEKPSVVSIDDNGKAFQVPVSGAGKHVLRIRQRVALEKTERDDSLALPVKAVANSRIVVEKGSHDAPIELSSARGRARREGAELNALLGPTPLIQIRRSAGLADRDNAAGTTVEGALVWDAAPAGDRLRAKLTLHHQGGTSLVRMALDPTAVVRHVGVGGLVEARREGDVWQARIEPPLPDGGSFVVDLWRPLVQTSSGSSDAADGRPKRFENDPRPSSRRVPKLELQGATKYSGMLAMRRPADWAGELRRTAGGEAIDFDRVVDLAGLSPPPDLVGAGAARFNGPPEAEVDVRPISARGEVTQKLQLAIEAGRVNLALDAEWIDVQGHRFDLEAAIPANVVLETIEADGLLAWSRPSADTIRILLDGRAAAKRSIRLVGWIPVAADPLVAGQYQRRLPVPWPRWRNADEHAGSLRMSMPRGSLAGATSSARATPPDLGPGAAALPPDAAAEAANASSNPARPLIFAYRVERPDALAPLGWLAEPPRVAVSVNSLLIMHPDSAEWLALVRYDVTGGPLGRLLLKLPTAWANAAQVESPGVGHQLSPTPDGASTSWAIQFNRPIWGMQQLLIRSNRAWASDEPLAFPDLVPLGWGTVDTLLAIADESGRELTFEGSAGLQPMDVAAFQTDGFPARPQSLVRAYRVRKEGWSLDVSAEGEGSASATPVESADVSMADVSCVLGGDGSTWGQARYDLDPGPAAFLTVVLPVSGEAVRATVDGHPVRVLRGASGRWLIPLSDEGARRVALVWRSINKKEVAGGSDLVPLPALIQARVPTLMTIYVPPSLHLNAPGGPIVSVSHTRIELERTEWLARRIAARLNAIDRSSARDRNELVADLTRFELQARSATRSAWFLALERGGPSSQDYQQSMERIGAMRQHVADAMRTSGLSEWLRDAQARVGQLADASAVEPSGPIEPGPRLRRLGEPHYFHSESLAAGRCPQIVVTPKSQPAAWQTARPWLLTLLGMATSLVAYGAVARGTRAWLMGTLTAAIAAILFAIGFLSPIAAAGALGLLVLGRFVRV